MINFGYYLLQITYLDNKNLFNAVLFEECCACEEPEACYCQNMKNPVPHCFAEIPSIIPSSLFIPANNFVNSYYQTKTIDIPPKAVGSDVENISSSSDTFHSCSPSSSTFGISELFLAQSVDPSLDNFSSDPVDISKSSEMYSTVNSVSYFSRHFDSIVDQPLLNPIYPISGLFADSSVFSRSSSCSRVSSRSSSPSRVSSCSHSSSVSDYLLPQLFSNSPQRSRYSSVSESDIHSVCSLDYLFSNSPHSLSDEIEADHPQSLRLRSPSIVSSGSSLSLTGSLSSSHSLSSSDSSVAASNESVSISDSLVNSSASWSSAGSW